MYEFLDRLVTLALPRIRDFRGVSPKAFDGRGNYTFGLKEQLIFPEIKYDDVASIHGMDITIVTTAKTNDGLKVAISSLKSQNVAFQVCSNTLRGRKIDYGKDLFEVFEEDIVPSGVAELAHLQAQGYTYIKP